MGSGSSQSSGRNACAHPMRQTTSILAKTRMRWASRRASCRRPRTSRRARVRQGSGPGRRRGPGTRTRTYRRQAGCARRSCHRPGARRRARVDGDVQRAEPERIRLRERETALARACPPGTPSTPHAYPCAGVAGRDGSVLAAAGSESTMAQSQSPSCGAGARSSTASSVFRSQPGRVGRSWLNARLRRGARSARACARGSRRSRRAAAGARRTGPVAYDVSVSCGDMKGRVRIP
jgi:hypothetical protein